MDRLAVFSVNFNSGFFTLTLVPGGTDSVINALPPITDPLPITVSPPSIEALE